MSKIRGIYCGIFCAFLTLIHLQAQTSHPADSNGDQRVDTSEVGSYHQTLKASIGNPEDSKFWMQAKMIWRHGERYQTLPNVSPPFHWVPDVPGKAFVSLTHRKAIALSQIEVLGLQTDEELEEIQVQFRISGTDVWVDADTFHENGRVTFEVPYLPDTMILSNQWSIRVRSQDRIWEGGDITYVNPRPKHLHASHLWQSIWNQIATQSPFDINQLIHRAESGESLNPEEKVFAFYGLTAAYNRDLAQFLEATPLRPESPLEQEVTDDLLYLILGEEMITGQTSLAPNLVETPRNIDKCVTIRAEDQDQGFIDMMFASKQRCRIQNNIDDDSFKKKATDKALEKIPDLVEKVASKWGKKAGKKMGASIGRAITIVLETRSFTMAWNTKNRPKYIRNLVAEPTFLDQVERGYFLEDGPLLSNGNCDEPFYIRSVRIDVESDPFSFLEYLIDNKIPETQDLLEAATSNINIPLKGVATTALTKLLEGPRKNALDRLKTNLSDLDVTFPPCQWKGIHVPRQTSIGTPLFTLEEIPGSALVPTEPNGFVVRSSGRGQLGLKMNVTDDFSTENSIPCLEPYSKTVEWPVNPIRVELEPSVVNVRPEAGPVILQAIIKDSYDHDQLKWELFDQQGRLLQETTTTKQTSLSTISAAHLWSFDAPKDESLYPLKVCATSLSKRCGRGSKPVRKAESQLFYNKRTFVIAPSSECIPPGDYFSVEAIPSDDTGELSLQWEVVEGDAEITVMPSSLKIELLTPDRLQSEIIIRATGNDGFFQEARYSVGDCLDGVNIWAKFETDFASHIQKGATLNANLSWMNIGGAQNQGGLPIGLPTIPTAPVAGIQGLTSFGYLDATIVDVKRWSQGGGGIMDLDLRGVQIGMLRADSPNLLDATISENASGLYIVEQDPEFTLPFIVDTFSFDLNDSSYSFRVYVELSGQEDDDFGDIHPIWEAVNGQILETQRVFDSDTEYYTHSATLSFPSHENNPQARLMMSGLVKNASEQKFYGIDFTSITIWNKFDVTGRSRMRFSDEPGEFVLCGLDGFSEMTDGLFQDGCCGKFLLNGYPRYEGVVRQTTTMHYITDFEENDEAAGSYLLWAGDDQPDIPYCSELPPVTSTPDPDPNPNPDPDPEPNPDPDPEPTDDETPEPLKHFLVNSPVVNHSFPPINESFRSQAPTGSSGIIQGTTENVYPVYEILNQEIALNRYNEQGQIMERQVVADADALDFIGSDLRLIAWLQWNGQEGILMERLTGDSTRLDFWGRTSSQDRWMAQEVIQVSSIGSFLGLGEFSGDGFVDLLEISNDQTVRIWPGTVNGFGLPQFLWDVPEGWRMRSVERVANTNQLLVGMDDFSGQFSLEYRNLDGTAAATPNIFAKPAFADQLMSFTDWNADGMPDMVIAPLLMESFNVRLLDDRLIPAPARTYTLPLFGQLPGLQ